MARSNTYIEELPYGGHLGYLDYCCLCGEIAPIHKYDFYHERDNKNYLEYNGIQLLCNGCRKE